MDDLSKKLLDENDANGHNPKKGWRQNKHRLTLMYQKNVDFEDSSFQFQTEDQERRKRYYSIVEEPDFAWNSEEILERSLLMNEQNGLEAAEQSASAQCSSMKLQQKKKEMMKGESEINAAGKKKSELNSRLFYMKVGPRNFIYWFNLFFNVLFRIGLVILLVEMIIQGDGDSDKHEEEVFIKVLLGLEGLVSLLYFLALTKILYTKSSDISVYFQKQFYEKPYAQIHLSRVMRKHFTKKKIVSNLCRLANPFTKFSKDMKISVMKQQFYKRIELVIVFLPLLGLFLTGTPWFDRSNETEVKFDVKLLMAIVVCMEGIHIILHYLFVYIFS